MKALKTILIIICCVVSSIIIVFPLWKFSTLFPNVYSLFVTALSIAALLYFIVIKIKKTPVLNTVCFFVNLILIASSLILIFCLVINQKRLSALITLLIFSAAVTVFNILTARKKHD